MSPQRRTCLYVAEFHDKQEEVVGAQYQGICDLQPLSSIRPLFKQDLCLQDAVCRYLELATHTAVRQVCRPGLEVKYQQVECCSLVKRGWKALLVESENRRTHRLCPQRGQ